VARLLAQHGLPTSFDGAASAEVVEVVARDKKRRGGLVPFVLVEAPGEVTPGHAIGDRELLAAVEEVYGR
jgi:3-dehydroquinate synthetase